MNNSALFMMILAIILLWGGLVCAIVHLIKHPDREE